MDSNYSMQSLAVHAHHIKQNICGSRARYRDGRKDRAVKVYTINQESVYLLISNVPAVGGTEDLRAICDQYGMVEDFKPLDGYPTEEFTEVYLVKYEAFPAARVAKKHLDDRSFLGGNLHVCYAPEFETVQETRSKLQERRKYVAWKTNTVHITGSYSLYGMEDSLETVPTEPILSLNCRFCEFIASNTEVLFKHETSHYKEPPVEFRSNIHTCHKCAKVFYNRSHLQSHLYTHDSAKHFVCNACHKSFRHSSSLARHRRSHKLQGKSR